ncbi:hypothetical protein [Kitasatospora cathayae]|uniref:Uncharacterized protein n=1 Tax=Kitasatospora cathayae TaxID=3004092 RepID=A0ABY7QBT9_9ACTN|nr:hypothetical protein [Kitasatospora sp. HUAS 3-15]WBP90224.1 hypothetical protein O1G21_33105 [Kitasatospora sp. HUAS 3-15]
MTTRPRFTSTINLDIKILHVEIASEPPPPHTPQRPQRPSTPGLPAAPGRADESTTLSRPVEFEPRPGLTYALDALQSPEALSLTMTADPAALPRPAKEEFLYGIQELIPHRGRPRRPGRPDRRLNLTLMSGSTVPA